MNKQIITNFLYNASYQVLVLFLPFITIPYVSRIFDAEQLGIFGFTTSLTQLFVMFASLGISAYGTKKIAQVNNKKELEKIFLSLFSHQGIMTIIVFLLFLLFFVLLGLAGYRNVFFAQNFLVLATLLDVSWVYFGKQQFKKTVVRNILVKLLSVLLIFILVRQNTDLIEYTMINGLSIFAGNLVLVLQLKKDFGLKIKIDGNLKRVFSHTIPMLTLFGPSFFYFLYTSFDRTILGIVAPVSEVGLYDQSLKLIRISIGIVSSLGLVMLPHVTSALKKEKITSPKIQKLLYSSLEFTIFMTVAISIGMMATAENFVPWFYGENFLNVSGLIIFAAPICIFTTISSLYMTQIAIPTDNKKVYATNIIVAIVAIMFIFIFGYYYQAKGAIVALLIAEFLGMLMRSYMLKNVIKIKVLIYYIVKYTSVGLVMYLVIRSTSFEPSMINTALLVMIGGSVYLTLSFVIKKLEDKFYNIS